MKKSKLISAVALSIVAVGALASCGSEPVSSVQKVIEEAQTLTTEELNAKAREEINGKELVVIANSSRTPKAATKWLEDQKKIDANFDFKCVSTQPKNNQIFTQIKSDVEGAKHNISLTLIQDGSQIASKMTSKGYLLNYIPKDWDGDKTKDGEPLSLQSLNKVFVYNTNGGNENKYNNCWDFALKKGTQFMSPKSEPVGQNFLYMLTRSDYAAVVKEAYDALSTEDKAEVDKIVLDADGNAGIAGVMSQLGTTDENVKYSLAWIYMFLKGYTSVSDDGPIAANLTKKDAEGAAGLLVYSKFRSTEETATTSNSWVQAAAYKEGYKGFGGYMYKHYLQVLKTSPHPWTACALINYMTTTVKGFSPWGADMGGYSSSPTVATGTDAEYHHSTGGAAEKNNGVAMPIKNDKGYDWWAANEAGKGRLILEDGAYASQVAPVMAEWINYL